MNFVKEQEIAGKDTLTLETFLTAYFQLYFPRLGLLTVPFLFLSIRLIYFGDLVALIIASASLLAAFTSLRKLLRSCSCKNIVSFHAALSVVGLMSLMTLLPFSVPLYKSFSWDGVMKFGVAALWIALHGVLVYYLMQRAKK